MTDPEVIMPKGSFKDTPTHRIARIEVDPTHPGFEELRQAAAASFAFCCDARADGGFMPQAHETVPNPPPEPLRCKGGTRVMRFGPPDGSGIPPDVIPSGGPALAKKLLNTRRDRPWVSTAKGKDFGRPPYMPDPEADGPRSPPQILAPLRTGKHTNPFSAYPHMPFGVAKPEPAFRGKSLKCGRAPDFFDSSAQGGPAMVSGLPLTGADKARSLQGRPQLPKPRTCTRKRDTFGDYPAHLPDPYKDNPLGGEPCACRKAWLGICVPRSKPQIPIVNVWDHPACLQTKAGTRVEAPGRMAVLRHEGRLGTTI